MVSDRPATQDATGLAAQTRVQAVELLKNLLHDRQRSEQRLADIGMRDPIKNLTGRSALDSAIADTRAMLQDLDLLLHEIELTTNGFDARHAVERAGNKTARNGHHSSSDECEAVLEHVGTL